MYLKKALRGTIIVLVFSFLAYVLGYFIRMLLARNLTVEEYGLFYAIFGFLSFFTLFTGLGTRDALAKYIPEWLTKKDKKKIKSAIVFVFILVVITSGIICSILFFSSNFLAQEYFHTWDAVLPLQLMLISFFLTSVLLVFSMLFVGYQRQLFYSLIEFVKNITILIGISIGFYFGLRILSPVYAFVGSYAISVLLFGVIFHIKCFPGFFKIGFEFDRDLYKKVIRYGTYLILVNIAALIIGYIDIISITYFRNLTEVGYYNIALPTAYSLLFFSSAIFAVLLPMSSELRARKDRKRLNEGVSLLYRYALLIVLPFVLMFFMFSKEIINILFGAKYLPAQPALSILSIGVLFYIFSNINNTLFYSFDKPKTASKVSFVGAGFNLVINLILVPQIGFVGAAISSAVCFFIMFMFSLKLISRNITIKDIWGNILRTLLSGMIFILAIYILKHLIALPALLEMIIIIAISAAVYAGMVLALRITSIKEIKGLIRQVVPKRFLPFQFFN